ncbi:hypothetical protein WJR50_12345 [Catalinimonas sp. 4WD22]|uniref:hypothetical protein n=1 Tax=Catalinimonas locisalis TaxID=3133978 RepID=UPI0031019752
MRSAPTLLLIDTAPLIVYKTQEDYSDYVPVKLSKDGSRILSFPAPQDLKSGEQLLRPILLKQGYWLDQQGVSPTTAFLQMTYEEYAALESPLAPQQLMDQILVKSPFVEMYYCGRVTDFKDVRKEINEAIRKDKLKSFQALLEKEE